jgi:hypothetical protein
MGRAPDDLQAELRRMSERRPLRSKTEIRFPPWILEATMGALKRCGGLIQIFSVQGAQKDAEK